MMTSRAKAAIGGVLVGLAVLASTTGALVAQESTPAADRAMADDMTMMAAGTPAPGDAEMTAQMQQMMEQCTQMMEMMSMMMGMMGDMEGMQGMEGMEGMEGMPGAAATPAP